MGPNPDLFFVKNLHFHLRNCGLNSKYICCKKIFIVNVVLPGKVYLGRNMHLHFTSKRINEVMKLIQVGIRPDRRARGMLDISARK